MTTPLTPQTPSPILASPVSLSSTSTLVNDQLDSNDLVQAKAPAAPSSASLVLEKLQEILDPDELAESLGSVPKFVVIGMESAGKSSVLSALTNLPLHVAGMTATRGPMKIASTKTPDTAFRCTISIEAINIDGGIKRHPFTIKPITAWSALRDQIRLAGDEARRLEVEGVVRTEDGLRHLTEAQRLLSCDDWPEYTMNTVVINISGNDQQDLQVIDLPGVGRKTSQHAVSNMIKEFIAKVENVIIHCMAAGSIPPTEDKCVELNIEVDPKGERTMVVMTQIDRIEDISDNSWIDMLTGDADRFDGWSPQLGIYPVRLAGPKEIKAGIASSQMRAIEQRLFRSPEWVQISQKSSLGSKLGLPAFRKNVLQLHQERISKWLQSIPSLLQKKKVMNAGEVSLLPALPENPIAALHDDVIGQFASKLRKELAIRSETYNKLAELQKKLMKDLCRCLPAVIPLFKKDESKIGSLRTEMGRPMCNGMASGQEKFWIDDILKLRDEFRSPRNGRCDDSEILAVTIRNSPASCRGIVDSHVTKVWELIEKSIAQLATIRPGASSTIIQAMNHLSQTTVLKSLVFSKDILEVGASDPAETAVHGQSFAHGLRCTARYTVENFERIYQPAKANATPSPGSSSGNDIAAIPTIPANVTTDDISDVLRLQSEIDIHLGLSIYRIGTMIGQKVQVDILAMLDQVESKLRIAFQLDQVEGSVRKRSRGLFETSNDRIKRAKLMEKERSLSEVESIVRAAIEQ